MLPDATSTRQGYLPITDAVHARLPLCLRVLRCDADLRPQHYIRAIVKTLAEIRRKDANVFFVRRHLLPTA